LVVDNLTLDKIDAPGQRIFWAAEGSRQSFLIGVLQALQTANNSNRIAIYMI
jgi:hypothetical protein